MIVRPMKDWTSIVTQVLPCYAQGTISSEWIPFFDNLCLSDHFGDRRTVTVKIEPLKRWNARMRRGGRPRKLRRM